MPDVRARKFMPHISKQNTSFSPSVTLGLLALSDVVIMSGAGAIIYLLYVGVFAKTFTLYMTALFLGTFFLLTAFYFSKLYTFEVLVNPVHHATKAVFVCVLVFLALVVLGFALKISATYSRIWFFSWALSATILVFLWRIFSFFLIFRLASTGRLSRNIVIVGGTKQAARLLAHLEQIAEPWNNIVGVFDDREKRIDETFAGYPVLGSLEDLIEYSRKNRIDDVIITLPWSAEMRLSGIIDKLVELPLDIHLGSDMAGLLYPSRSFSFLGGVPMLDIAGKPLAGRQMIMKEIENRILAFILLILFAPVMALIAVAVKLDSRGPALFRQTRYGFNNQPFKVFKFRTMYHDRPPEKGLPQATAKDSRVTRVGAFLRRTSLDELPQLINVLEGTMSLVGPRPHAVQHNEEYAIMIDGYFARHKVKPGITGWAQVNGFRGETDTLDKMKVRIEYDLYYIENWSLAFDLKILVMTAFVVFFQKTAY